MTNTIGITWTSDQRQLIADFQKRQAMLEQEVQLLKKLGNAGKTTGDTLQNAGRERRKLETEAARLIEKTMTSQERHNAAVEKYKKLLSANLITQQHFNRAVQQSQEVLDGVSKTPMSGLLTDVKSLAVQWMSVQTVVRSVRAEIDAVIDRQRQAQNSQRPYSEMLFEVAKNFGPVDANQLSKLDTVTRDISRERGAMPRDVLSALNMALAGRVGGTTDDAIAATRVAAGLTHDPQSMGEISRSLLTQRATDPGKTMEEIAGEQIVAKQLSPTVTDEAFSQHVGPQLAMAKQFGNTFAEAAAMSAVLARRMADKEGRISTNAFITLETQLAELMPEVKGGTMSKIEALQRPEYHALRAKLLGGMAEDWEAGGPLKSKLEGERKAFLPLLALVGGDNDALAEYRDYLSQMPQNRGEAEGIVKNLDDLRRKHPLMVGADFERRAEADVEREKLGDPQAQAAVVRKYLADKMAAMGDSALSQYVSGIQHEIQTGLGERQPVANLSRILGTRADELERGRDRRPQGGDRWASDYIWNPMLDAVFGKSAPYSSGAPTEQEAELAQRLRQFIEQLAPAVQNERMPARPPAPRPAQPAPQPNRQQSSRTPPVNVNVSVVMPGQGERAPQVPAAALGTVWG